MKCDRCRTQTDGVIGGFADQNGEGWCVSCCDAAGLKVPLTLRQHHVGDGHNQIAADWAAKKKAEKRAKLDEFLAKRKAAADAEARVAA